MCGGLRVHVHGCACVRKLIEVRKLRCIIAVCMCVCGGSVCACAWLCMCAEAHEGGKVEMHTCCVRVRVCVWVCVCMRMGVHVCVRSLR